MMSDGDLGSYEGLVRTTAARYAPLLDDDFDDVAQVLRMKVWQALDRFDPSRSNMDVRNYVFQCVRNRLKDLFKQQDRLNKKRRGAQLYIEDFMADAEMNFTARHLKLDQEVAYFSVEDEDIAVPSTLNELERSVVALLLLDFSQAEIARQLNVGRARIRSAHASVQEKMADWRPSQGDILEAPVQIPQAA